MKILKSNWLLGTLVALSLVGSSVTVALANDFGHMGMRGIFKELNLTADQKEKLKKLREESKAGHKDERKKMRSEAKAFKDKMAGNASDDELRKEFAKAQEKRAEMAKSRFEHMLKVRAILTPEQRKKFAELAEKKMKNHKGKRGKKHDNEEDDDQDDAQE